jgi:replication-associated recombination protein RarA
VIGHDTARRYLETHLPPATLLHGPASVGKWTLALHLADHHQVAVIDRWLVEYGFSIDTVRLVTAYAARRPHGPFKLIVARLDDSSKPALNALLKTLEEPPPRVRFILLSTKKTLPTVASRCTTFELGLLSGGELQSVYQGQGLATGQAEKAARHARGQVARGYAADTATNHHHQVVNLAKALATGDRDLFTAVFATWDGANTDLLTTLFTECLTHRWTVFAEADTFGLHRDRTRLWRMVSAITRLPQARPRLGIRAALEPFLSR